MNLDLSFLYWGDVCEGLKIVGIIFSFALVALNVGLIIYYTTDEDETDRKIMNDRVFR